MNHAVQATVFASEPSSFWYMLVFFCYLLLMRPHRRHWGRRGESPATAAAPNPVTPDHIVAQIRSASAALVGLSDELALMILTTRTRIALDPQANPSDPVMGRLLALSDEVHCEIFDAMSLLDVKRCELQISIDGDSPIDAPAIRVCIRDRILSVVRRSEKVIDLVHLVNKLHPTNGGIGGAEKIHSGLQTLSRIAHMEAMSEAAGSQLAE